MLMRGRGPGGRLSLLLTFGLQSWRNIKLGKKYNIKQFF